MKAAVLIFIVGVIGFYGCTHKAVGLDVVTPVDSTNNNHSVDSNTTSTVCFQRDILPIFTGSCIFSGCHDAVSAKKGYVLTNYASIVANGLVPGNFAASKLYTQCGTGQMPKSPYPKLDSTQLSRMRLWINQGAHNDSNCTTNCDSTKYTFAAAIVPILHDNCYSCHATASASASGGGVILDTYNGVLLQARNGKLLGDLQHGAGFNAMPLGGSKLDDCKITQVRKWIQADTLNN